MADLKSILDPLDAPREVKAAAWDHFNAATDQQDFQRRFDTVKLPREVKAALWDAKFGGAEGTPAPAAPLPPIPSIPQPPGLVPHPDVVDQQTTQNAVKFAEVATRPPQLPVPAATGIDLADLMRRAGLKPASIPLQNRDGLMRPKDVPLSGTEDAVMAPLKFLGDSATQMGQGMTQVAHPESGRDFAGGVSNTVRGGLGLATPFMLPAALAAPGATAVTLGTGTVLQAGTEKLLKAAGVPEEYAAVGSDLISVFGAGAAYAKLRALSKLPYVTEANGIAAKLRAAVGRAKDTSLSAAERGAAKAQAGALLDGVKSAEAGQPSGAGAVAAAPAAGGKVGDKQPAPATSSPASSPSVMLPRELAGAKPRYSYGDKKFELEFANDVDRAAYITAQSTRSKRDAEYLNFVMRATGMSEAEVRAHGAAVRQHIKERARSSEPGKLKIASLAKARGSQASALPVQATLNTEAANGQRPTAAVDAGTTGAVDAGTTGEGRAHQGSPAAGAGRAPGEETSVLIPGEERSIRARYELRELDQVQASHNGRTFSANPEYAHRNERDYSKPENQGRVIEDSSEERFNPRYHISDDPTAQNGPTLIDEDGNALGGNSRAMMLQRVYGRDGQAAAAYRALLEKKASQFGIDPAEVAKMRRPVLVRVADNADLESLPGGHKWAIRKTNVSGTAALSASERATADAGQMSPRMVEHIAGAIENAGANATLNDALTGKSGTSIVNHLIDDGFFSEQERPALMDGKTGALTQAARDRIGKALLGRFFRDSDQFARTPASIRNKLERIAAPLTKVGDSEWDLTPAIREGIDLIEYAQAHGIKNLHDVTAQQGLFEGGGAPKWNSDAVTLAEWLRDAKPNELVTTIRKYLGDREPTMFGESTPAEAFATHFGGEMAERPKAGDGEPPAPPSSGGEPPMGEPPPEGRPSHQPPTDASKVIEPPAKAAVVAEDAPKQDPGPGPLLDFLRDEEGTSHVGAIIKADAAEARALLAKRNAAMKELERAQATPEQKESGQKILEYFTSERDLWGARINQVIDRVRKYLPDPVEQEALSLMRDFKHRPGELQAWRDGTHPTLAAMNVNERAAAVALLEKLHPAIDAALKPTPRMLEVDKVLTQIADDSLEEGKRLGFLESRWTPDEYLPHILRPAGESQLPSPMGDSIGKALGGKIGRKFAFAQKRDYPTLIDAVADGVKPRTLNSLDAFTIHADKFATARATHLLANQLREAGVGRWSSGSKGVPKGWREIAPHAELFRNEVNYLDENGEPQSAQQTLYVPPWIEQALRPVTDPDYLNRVKGFRFWRASQSWTKAAQLGMSLFHATSENYMALANMGPKGWARALRADRDSAQFLRMEREFIAHGGTTSIQGRTFEAYKALQPGSIPTWSDIWRRAPVAAEMDGLARRITDLTFDRLQRQFKVVDYAMHKAAWLGNNPGASQLEIADASQSISKEINAVYGGLHTENLGINAATMNMARAILLAPDWTFSNIFNLKYAAERGTPAGQMARAFWVRTAIGGMVATQTMSLALSGKPSRNPTQVYMGTDAEGQEIYQNVFFKGAPGDVVTLVNNMRDHGAVEGLVQTMANKFGPLPRTGLDLIAHRDRIAPKGMNPVASTVRGAVQAGKDLAPVPMSFGAMKDMLIGPKAGLYTWPEYLTTPFGGQPPRHVAPDGMRMSKTGLKPSNEKPRRSILEEITTGKR